MAKHKADMLVVAPHPFFTPRGTPFSVYYRTMVLAEAGVKIDLLTYGVGQDVDIPGCRIVRVPRIKALEPVPIGPSGKKLVLDVFMLLWTIGMMFKHQYKIVHAHEEAVFWVRFLKPLFLYKMIYDGDAIEKRPIRSVISTATMQNTLDTFSVSMTLSKKPSRLLREKPSPSMIPTLGKHSFTHHKDAPWESS